MDLLKLQNKNVSMYTIGHSTLTFEEFSKKLINNKIEILADIRSFPGSRRYPHFNKEELEKSILSLGIKYFHIPNLGGFRKSSIPRKEVNTGWRNSSFKNYADYTLTKEYENGIEQLLELSKNKIVCYFCSEAVCWRCHRLLVSNTLVARGYSVIHIVNSSIDEHFLGKYGAEPTINENRVEYHKQNEYSNQLVLNV